VQGNLQAAVAHRLPGQPEPVAIVKTALAVHAAHRLLPGFPDGHLYADLHGYTEGQAPAGPGEVLEVFLRRLGVPSEEMPAEVEERSGLLRQLPLALRMAGRILPLNTH
jgi:hypothetical protein